jgi:hypothetical protein
MAGPKRRTWGHVVTNSSEAVPPHQLLKLPVIPNRANYCFEIREMISRWYY